MALTKVTSGMVNPDPTNASNLSSGDVPLAQLDNAPATDVTGLEDDIALLGFKVASNGSLAKYNLVDQTVDDFQDASGIDASASTDEVRDSSGKYYSGTTAVPANATGGTVTTHGSYTVNTFTSSSDFVTPAAGTISYLIVGAGAGGSQTHGASGGGGGGVQSATSQSISAGTHAVVIGAGTTGAGGNSTFNSVTANGGAVGGGYAGTGGTSGAPQSNAGGGGHVASYSETGGGGGGAGATGAGSNPNVHGGMGGAGLDNDFHTGSNIKYGTGGSGGGARDTSGSAAADGGGSGGNNSSAGTPPPASRGGGGGGNNTGSQQSGAAGVVAIRYTTDSFSTTSYDDMTLVSNSTTAEAVPTKGDMVITYTNGAGTATLNTDLKAYVSRDNGTNYTQGTLASQGTTGGHTIITFHDLDVSSQPSGSAMRYKIETLNQSVSKQTRIQAVSLGWS